MTPSHEHGSPRCREMLEHLSEYLDRELDPASCAELESHMRGCEPCVAFLRSLRATVAHVGSLARPAMSDETKRACVEAYERYRKEQGRY